MLLSLTQPDYSILLLPSSSTANNVSVRQKQDADRKQRLCTSPRLQLGQS